MTLEFSSMVLPAPSQYLNNNNNKKFTAKQSMVCALQDNFIGWL